MGWLRLVGSLKLQVSFAECHLFYRAFLQKRPVILRSLLIVATPYLVIHVSIDMKRVIHVSIDMKRVIHVYKGVIHVSIAMKRVIHVYKGVIHVSIAMK